MPASPALAQGKLRRLWLETDRLGFLRAMGAVPEGVGASGPKPE